MGVRVGRLTSRAKVGWMFDARKEECWLRGRGRDVDYVTRRVERCWSTVVLMNRENKIWSFFSCKSSTISLIPCSTTLRNAN